MISQYSRSRQICFVRVDASLGTSATDINPATNPAFFFFSSSWGSGELQLDELQTTA